MLHIACASTGHRIPLSVSAAAAISQITRNHQAKISKPANPHHQVKISHSSAINPSAEGDHEGLRENCTLYFTLLRYQSKWPQMSDKYEGLKVLKRKIAYLRSRFKP